MLTIVFVFIIVPVQDGSIFVLFLMRNILLVRIRVLYTSTVPPTQAETRRTDHGVKTWFFQFSVPGILRSFYSKAVPANQVNFKKTFLKHVCHAKIYKIGSAKMAIVLKMPEILNFKEYIFT